MSNSCRSPPINSQSGSTANSNDVEEYQSHEDCTEHFYRESGYPEQSQISHLKQNKYSYNPSIYSEYEATEHSDQSYEASEHSEHLNEAKDAPGTMDASASGSCRDAATGLLRRHQDIAIAMILPYMAPPRQASHRFRPLLPSLQRGVSSPLQTNASVSPADSIESKPKRQWYKRSRVPPEDEEGLKMYDECSGLKFQDNFRWNQHMDKHERPYECSKEGSGKAFTNPHTLAQHKEGVHGVRRIYCKHSDEPGFRQKSNLNSHVRQCHPTGPREILLCPVKTCPRGVEPGFRRTDDLDLHVRRVHPTRPRKIAARIHEQDLRVDVHKESREIDGCRDQLETTLAAECLLKLWDGGRYVS
ncbi:hypothetical protein P154DRAFT_560542 [Amniculicola lignicola CBS 123094]|uniref:C2H2-type domain-containing protein n=1 Tax=Amniculicola lignicola CBS 123094 TaxID=1392246 RepID=A0A6A5WR68_9PLEO|nr:hypothetical protein P154DRAFT_560542 [Amniculicola lignicola CBS 123094]